MPNMSYCMFENTSNDMQDLIDKMYEDDFNPNNLSIREKRAFDQLYDQVETMRDRLSELDEIAWEEEDSE